MQIEDLRKRIDALDAAFLQLINLRAEFALEIGELKRAQGACLHVPGRERQIVTRLRRMNPGPLDSAAIARIYRLILDESLRLQNGGASGVPKAAAALGRGVDSRS